MRSYEFINEIITVDELMPLTADKKNLIDTITDTHYRDDIYYGYSGSTLVVSTKKNNSMTSCAVCIKYHNPHYDSMPYYYVPKNMYSWVKDNGVTTTKLIKAILSISDIPVLGDIEMTPYAKKAFKRKIDNNDITAKIFNLCDGSITAYDSSIWENDDECRVIFFEHTMGKPLLTLKEQQSLLMDYSYNYKTIKKYYKQDI